MKLSVYLSLSFLSLNLALTSSALGQDSGEQPTSATSSQLAAMALTISDLKKTIDEQNATIDGLKEEITALSEAKLANNDEAEQLLSFKYRPRLRTVFFTFSNDTKPTLIPGSERASFCALTYVDDVTETGSCKVFIQNSAWHVQSGDSFAGNHCAAACLFID